MISVKELNSVCRGHRFIIVLILCLFGLFLAQAMTPVRKNRRAKSSERIYLLHADELFYNQFGNNPGAQIVKGHVAFRHQGAYLSCDSAYFYQESNSVKAFGHVYFKQGDTLSLSCNRATYDGAAQQMEARKNVVVHHRRQVLRTDSLNYDRLYNQIFFFDGGSLVDGHDKLVSDWGTYYPETRQAVFYYNVHLRSPKHTITTDTLYYDVKKAMAHILGPKSRIRTGQTVISTSNAYYNTRTERARMYGRSTVVDGTKTITGDSLFYVKNGFSRGYGRVIYRDLKNHNALHCGYFRYNEKTGYGFATRDPVAFEYSHKDTLYVHSDTMKIFTFNMNKKNVYRKVLAFHKVKAFRTDIQAICDSLVYNSKDSCMTMYHDPIVWNADRQLLGEVIMAYLADSTLRKADVIGQALSVQILPDSVHYNQISSKVMHSYFIKGNPHTSVAIGNVQAVYYPVNDKDSSLMGLNYTETDTMKMYMSPEKKLQRIWMPKSQGTLYPMTQIPPSKLKLPDFQWFADLRPKNKDDIFVWRGKGQGQQLKMQKRHEAPLQHLEKPTGVTGNGPDTSPVTDAAKGS
ncbi:hypothetical protein NG821_05020 [Prevotella cerevisiae]|uniref:Organic solvent tolerance-like N-terminal domain-containing protein n=1 Tax=Segatella cerevisiae TaxID=2053716 RepID=A0ABT1BW60_9BACT|nr:OstA-like protein [Segatella cerevisiae]MCO6025204.1 hypothetical protein [Segatella cerevisiae]